jgi:hypothetical protein
MRSAAAIPARSFRARIRSLLQRPEHRLPDLSGVRHWLHGRFARSTYGGSLIRRATWQTTCARVRKASSPRLECGCSRLQLQQFHDSAPDAGSSNTSATWGTIDENVDRCLCRTQRRSRPWRQQAPLQRRLSAMCRPTRSSARACLARSAQSGSPGFGPNPPMAACIPNVVTYEESKSDYDKVLPSANVAMHLGENAVVRAGLSRTMTRPTRTRCCRV